MDGNETTIHIEKICGRSREDLLSEIKKFHGHIAPGLVLGAIMVDWAQELIGQNVEADAVVETLKCLPDAVQIFTPCTIGNGWLKVLDWNQFALCLYDKKSKEGFRIWMDIEKSKRFPNLHKWFMHLASKKDLPLEALLETIFQAGRDVLSCRAVRIAATVGEKTKRKESICPSCGESYLAEHGLKCNACGGKGYYSISE